MPSEAGRKNSQQSLSASSARPLRMHVRADLEVQRQVYQGRDYWVVKDPLTLKYFRFEEEEWALLQLLGGQQTADQVKLQFDYQFAPQKITLPELYQFIGMLHRSSLLVSESPQQGIQLKKRGDKSRRNQVRQTLSNVLAIRFKGIDPDRLLSRMNCWLGWMFSVPAMLMALVFGLCALGLIFTNFELFQAKLPSFRDFFAAKNWLWLALVMAGTKVLHELGHGMVCKRFGAHCHEMGFMLLIFTPCLYVNVSDAWLLPGKWKRIFISAAGIYVELILAACAVFVWWFSHPGLVNQLALNVIFVCSVSTIVINANPLLRYDGYYILSDLLEIPNLRTKASKLFQQSCSQWLLGIESRKDPFMPNRGRLWFILYSLAAIAYRWFLTLSIFWFLYRMLEPYGLQIIGQLLAMAIMYGLLVAPIWKLYKYFSVPGRIGTVKPVRFTISAGAMAFILAAVCLIPVPHHVYCHVHLQAESAANVYVEEAGILQQIHVEPNSYVEAGEPILTLSNHRLRVQLASLQTKLDLAKIEEENVLAAVAVDDTASNRISLAKTAVLTAQDGLARRADDLNRLEIRAPITGRFLAPPKTPRKETDSGELGDWDDTPLNPKNLGAHLEKQTLVGQVVPDLGKMEAVLAIDQGDIEYIAPEQPVELLIDGVPARRFRSMTGKNIMPAKMKSVPKALSSRHGGAIVVNVDKDGIEVPQSTTFLIKVPLLNADQLLYPGNVGVAKIRTGSLTLAARMWRGLNQIFQFEL
jgi:putative peptide zinc metalloprotease protein